MVEAVRADQRASVEAWRLQQLLEAGWTFHRATQLASRLDVDLHQAIRLLRYGCSQKLAMKILL